MKNRKPNKTSYDKPAGGWDALTSSFTHLREQGILGRGISTMLKANQVNGFDCPGCAWPDRNPHSTFEFCENGVKAVAAEATSKRISRDFFACHPVSELALQDDYFLEAQGRLTEPMQYDTITDCYQTITWDAAFEKIATQLRALPDPNQALFYTSGRTSNEAAFLYQLFVREFGTNNLPDCSNMCHEPSGVAMSEQIGVGKGTVSLNDFELAEAIFIFGQNPGTNHPRMLGELRSAAKRGCKIVVFNPLRERGLERFTHPQNPLEMISGGATNLASHYYQIKIGGDLALAIGLLKHLFFINAVDTDFVALYTINVETLKREVESASWDEIETHSGLTKSQIIEAAQVYADSNASIFCWGMGITQHQRSVAAIQMLMNVLLLKGNIGKPGAGPCPVRGHSNVQGDRTMGIVEKPSEVFLDRLAQEFKFIPPREFGHDVVGAIEAMHAGTAKVFFALGGNFAVATPDTEKTAIALRQCDLTVHVSTKLNRSHLVHGKNALILPCLGRTEIDLQNKGAQAVTVEDSMSMVHLSSGMNPPTSTFLLSEPAIVAQLANATLRNSNTPWLWLIEDYDRIRECISRVIDGFENFNTRVRQAGGFSLLNHAAQRNFRTNSKLAEFLTHPLVHAETNSKQYDGADTLLLTTIRSHDQYNTTIYGFEDRYRGVSGSRRVCFISAIDLTRLGFRDGEVIDVISIWHDGERIAKNFSLREYDIPPGCIAAYYPETNALVPLDSFAIGARTPTSKSIRVRLQLSQAIALKLES